MSMDLFGEVAGRIGYEGGGGDVADVKVKTSSQYESVVNPEDKTAYIDLSVYAKESELSGLVTSESLQTTLEDYTTDEALQTTLEDYTTYEYTESRYTPLATFNNYTITAESHFQKTLVAGENITINPVTNVISASGGGGGGLDLPTDGTPVEIGTFGNMTLYAQSVSVNANTYALCRFWTGQAGDIVLSANAIAVCNASNNVKMVVPSSITNQVSFSWLTDDYEALPHISIYSTLDSNLWSRGAVIKGMVIFAR